MLIGTHCRWAVSQEAEEDIWKVREEAIRHLQSESGYEEAARKKFLDEEMASALRRMQLATEWEAEQHLQSPQSPDALQQHEQSDSALACELQDAGNISLGAQSNNEFRINDRNDAEFEPEIEEAFPAEDAATLLLFRELAAQGRDSQALRCEQAPCDEAPVQLASTNAKHARGC